MFGEMTIRLALGLMLSAAIGVLAYWRRALTSSGVVGAIVVGTCVFGFGGWVRGLVLVFFFVASSLLSHYKGRQKAALAEKFAKGSRRDLAQTLANGALAAILAAGAGLADRAGPVYPLLALGFYGAMATVNADTWATELGVLARSRPRLITSGRPVPVGTSGGVTIEGFLAALAGALSVGVAGFVFIQVASLLTSARWMWGDWIVIPIAAVGGLIGSAVDSWLGASVQANYRCDRCNVETERVVHRCGLSTRHVRGWLWLDNDWVNLLASFSGAAAAALLGILLL